MERVPIVSCLRDRTDFRFPQTLVHRTRLEKTEATAVVHELLQQTFQLFSPRAPLQVGKRASWTDSSWDLISSWRTWMRV